MMFSATFLLQFKRFATAETIVENYGSALEETLMSMNADEQNCCFQLISDVYFNAVGKISFLLG